MKFEGIVVDGKIYRIEKYEGIQGCKPCAFNHKGACLLRKKITEFVRCPLYPASYFIAPTEGKQQ